MNYTKTIQIDAPVEDVFAFCASPDGFEAICLNHKKKRLFTPIKLNLALVSEILLTKLLVYQCSNLLLANDISE